MKRLGLLLLFACALAPVVHAAKGDGPRTVRLKNGLTLLLAPDTTAASVDLAVWYRAGTRDERPGQTGISHLFEHLMFRGSPNHAPGEHIRLLQAEGGSSNAFTTADYTCFHQTLPPAALSLAMQLEADRMRGLRLSQETLDRERAAVAGERRLRAEDGPVGRGLQRLYELAWPGHPYRWPVIGLEEDLARITVEDCRRWHEQRYAPGNALVTVVGRFDPDEALALAKRWFEAVPKRPSPAPTKPRVPALAPGARAETAIQVPVPLLIAGWRAPGHADPDQVALEALSRLLAGGPGSRLHETLVRSKPSAVFVQGGLDGRQDGQLFYVLAAVPTSSDAATVEAELVGEVERLAREDVRPEELDRVKRQLETALLQSVQTTRGRAARLGAAQLFAAAHPADAERDRIRALTAADLRRAAGRVLQEGTRLVVWARPTGVATEGGRP